MMAVVATVRSGGRRSSSSGAEVRVEGGDGGDRGRAIARIGHVSEIMPVDGG